MTGGPADGTTEELDFWRVTGEMVHALAAIDRAPSRVGDFLTVRKVVLLDDNREFRQLRVMEGPDRVTGYEHLDNEILAGRRLHRVVGDDDYPLAVSRLFGDTEGGDYRPAGTRRENKAAADPYALLDPYRGKPLHAVVGQMMDGEQEDFEASLLAGLCWLEAAGIAHRGLSPWTVRWDTHRRQAQITDFSLSTVFGVPREAIGPPKWVGPEQRPGGKVGGVVTERDDMHAAARLIYYVRSLGGEISRLDQLGELELEYLRPLFSSPDQRLTAAELLARRGGGGNPVPRGTGSDMRLENGRKRFDSRRRDKHPDAAGLGGQSGGTSNGDARNLPAGGDGPGTPGGGIPPRDPAEPVPAPPMMPGTTQPEEPADRGKRARWRRGNRF